MSSEKLQLASLPDDHFLTQIGYYMLYMMHSHWFVHDAEAKEIGDQVVTQVLIKFKDFARACGIELVGFDDLFSEKMKPCLGKQLVCVIIDDPENPSKMYFGSNNIEQSHGYCPKHIEDEETDHICGGCYQPAHAEVDALVRVLGDLGYRLPIYPLLFGDDPADHSIPNVEIGAVKRLTGSQLVHNLGLLNPDAVLSQILANHRVVLLGHEKCCDDCKYALVQLGVSQVEVNIPMHLRNRAVRDGNPLHKHVMSGNIPMVGGGTES